MTTETEKDKPKGLDIFEVLNAISRGDTQYYSKLSDHQKKSFSPFLIYQWLLGNSLGNHTIMLNFANRYIFPLHRHPELLYKLLVTCSQLSSGRFSWTQYAKSKPSSTALNSVVAKAFGVSHREAEMFLPYLDDSDVVIYANELGLQNDEIKTINDQLSKRRTK